MIRLIFYESLLIILHRFGGTQQLYVFKVLLQSCADAQLLFRFFLFVPSDIFLDSDMTSITTGRQAAR